MLCHQSAQWEKSAKGRRAEEKEERLNVFFDEHFVGHGWWVLAVFCFSAMLQVVIQCYIIYIIQIYIYIKDILRKNREERLQ